MVYDLVIVGAGAAGISAAIYAKRSGMTVLVIEKGMLGGTIGTTGVVDNYLGFPNITGSELAFNFFEHLKILEIPYKIAEVLEVSNLENENMLIKTKDEDFSSRKVIVATGRRPKLLDLSNTKELIGRGISTCAQCDAMFYKGKDVAVIGGGNSAIEEAIYLSKIVNKVYLIHRKNDYLGDEDTVDKLRDINNIEEMHDALVTKIDSKDGLVDSITLNKEIKINVAGVFMYIGYTPVTDFLKDLNILDEEGYVIVKDTFETYIKGLYACGDVVKKKYYQVVIAAGEGAITALNASKS